MQKKVIQNQIENYMKIEKKYRSDLLLVLIANVEGETLNYEDYEKNSVLSEYYTLEEYETISTTCKKLGYEVLGYFNESAFMTAIVNEKIHLNQKKILVINSAQTGTHIGRKSLIPAFCEYFKIMYAGSNPYVVSLCRDKFHSNILLNGYVDNILNTYLYSPFDGWIGGKSPQIGKRVIAKLNAESASIGLEENNVFVYNQDADSILKRLSLLYNQSIIIQPFISGYEIELPIIIGKDKLPTISAGIKIGQNEMLGDKILDYNARFNHTYTYYNFDVFNCSISNKAKAIAVMASELLGIKGFGRIDFRVTSSGDCYISDIATNPHITKDSAYAFVFQQLGFTYSEMMSTMIGVCLSKYLA